MNKSDYEHILVESFIPDELRGRHGEIHIHPLPNQEPFLQEYFVQCNKELSEEYPVGTKFRIKAKLTNRKGTPYISSHYTWNYEVLK